MGHVARVEKEAQNLGLVKAEKDCRQNRLKGGLFCEAGVLHRNKIVYFRHQVILRCETRPEELDTALKRYEVLWTRLGMKLDRISESASAGGS